MSATTQAPSNFTAEDWTVVANLAQTCSLQKSITAELQGLPEKPIDDVLAETVNELKVGSSHKAILSLRQDHHP